MQRFLLFFAVLVIALGVGASPILAQMVGSWNTAGAVRLTWTYAGGTCTVNYREVGSTVWNFQTSTDCDEGQIVIGGLQPGQKYSFIVNPEGRGWSRVVTAIAKVVSSPVTQPTPGSTTPSISWAGSVNGNGAVRLSWVSNGPGQCWIRYGESRGTAYPYSTVADCGDNGVTIHALLPGHVYKFQISTDGVNWLQPIRMRAYQE